MRMFKAKRLYLWIVVGLCCLAKGGLAQEEKPTEPSELEEIVVTATKVEKGIGDVPVSASVVTKEEIEKRRVAFVDEALKYVAGVVQRRTKFADTMSGATLRGFSGGQRTLVLIDGTPLNDAYGGGTYLNYLPLGDIQKIEVIKGPFSSLYGGEAMGGVITEVPQVKIAKMPVNIEEKHIFPFSKSVLKYFYPSLNN